MPADSQSLYGIRKPKATASKKDVASSSTLAFTTHLSSLISKETNKSNSSSSTPPPSRSRPRPSRSKNDIFAVHNKNAHKRAAADLSNDSPHIAQSHQQEKDIGYVDDATLHRSKRRMAEKVRLYEDLKKGEYLADSDDEENTSQSRSLSRAEGNSLVDFDRKWAEEEKKKIMQEENSLPKAHQNGYVDDGDDDDEINNPSLLVEYEDEFGRIRQGTRAEAAEASRLRQEKECADDPKRAHLNLPASARPERPSNLIHGSTVQSAAFNPDANVTAHMEHLAKNRDRTPTPPPETHYEADGEVRTRGTGFYAFSKDETERRQEMDDLLKARQQTMDEREGTSKKKEAREKAKEERKRKIEELRSKRRADEFLKELGGMPMPNSGEKEEES